MYRPTLHMQARACAFGLQLQTTLAPPYPPKARHPASLWPLEGLSLSTGGRLSRWLYPFRDPLGGCLLPTGEKVRKSGCDAMRSVRLRCMLRRHRARTTCVGESAQSTAHGIQATGLHNLDCPIDRATHMQQNTFCTPVALLSAEGGMESSCRMCPLSAGPMPGSGFSGD